MLAESSRVINAITVDLEDWYQGLTRTMYTPERWRSLPARVEETTVFLLNLFSETGVHATFFVLGFLAQQHPHLIKQIANAGHELASHGFSHQPIYRLTPQQFKQELLRTKDVIEQNTSTSVIGFRAPQFSINGNSLWAFSILTETGHEYDSSVFPARSLFYGYPQANRLPYRPIPNSNLVEYPIATIPIGHINIPIAGGVYNRFLPYPFINWALSKLNQQGVPAVIYVHPWEFDLEQPRISVKLRERITHYGMRKTLENKMRKLLKTFPFAPLCKVHKEWLSKN